MKGQICHIWNSVAMAFSQLWKYFIHHLTQASTFSVKSWTNKRLFFTLFLTHCSFLDSERLWRTFALSLSFYFYLPHFYFYLKNMALRNTPIQNNSCAQSGVEEDNKFRFVKVTQWQWLAMEGLFWLQEQVPMAPPIFSMCSQVFTHLGKAQIYCFVDWPAA